MLMSINSHLFLSFFFMFFRKRTRKRKKRSQKGRRRTGREIKIEKENETETETEKRRGNEREKGKENEKENVNAKSGNAVRKTVIGTIGTETVIGMIVTETVTAIEIAIVKKHVKKIGSLTERRTVTMTRRRRWTEDGERGDKERRMQLTKRFEKLFCVWTVHLTC